MRLLNVYTLEFKEFYDNPVPYAILSHTWEEEEVTYEDFVASTIEYPDDFDFDEPWESSKRPTVSGPTSELAGFRKLRGFCDKAMTEGFEWAWIDTCCINKSSSAELSEAINAMFAWYRDASVCYAYLSDVMPAKDRSTHPHTSFKKSRWYSRGWTLQELIAPSEVVFLAKDWSELGTRRSLCALVSTITGIDRSVLREPHRRADFSLAQRMSWASGRLTTRVEDMAYCLLGLFDVNMPLLYGEGNKAFLRLQREILASSWVDTSILAWDPAALRCREEKRSDLQKPHSVCQHECSMPRVGLLATSPHFFALSSRIVNRKRQNHDDDEGSLRHRDSSAKPTGHFVELDVPTFGPLDPAGAYRGGLARVLSPSEARLLVARSWQYKGMKGEGVRRGSPFELYVRAPSWPTPNDGARSSCTGVWDRVLVALVGSVRCGEPIGDESGPLCAHPSYFHGPVSCGFSYSIGILLERDASDITRLLYPALVAIELEAADDHETHHISRLQSWPPTVVHALATRPAGVSPLAGTGFHRNAKLMSVPGGYRCRGDHIMVDAGVPGPVSSRSGRKASQPRAWGGHFVYPRTAVRVYNYEPAAAGPVSGPAITLSDEETSFSRIGDGGILFSEGPDGRPAFGLRLHLPSKLATPNHGPVAALSLGIDWLPAERLGELTWVGLEYERKTVLQLSERESVTIARRQAPDSDLYYVSIEDVVPEPNRSHSRAFEAEAAEPKYLAADFGHWASNVGAY